jgi:hypothetical protein
MKLNKVKENYVVYNLFNYLTVNDLIEFLKLSYSTLLRLLHLLHLTFRLTASVV